MFPILFSIGGFSISSYGVFLAVGFLYGIFLIWRLSRAWDLDEERVLDLTLIIFVGGLIGARLYFFIENSSSALSLPQIVLIHKFPGFSFWGAILGGWLTLAFFAKKFRIDFWQAADIASVGLLAGLIFADIGCLLGGCNVGIQSNLILAVHMVGTVGKRIPIQVIEALLLVLVLKNIWKKATHFHPRGTILSISLTYIGVIKLVTEPFREVHKGNYILSLVLIVLGLTLFYKVTGRNVLNDLKNLAILTAEIITTSQRRKSLLAAFQKNWYNFRIGFIWKMKSLGKILRRLNVRFSRQAN